MKSHYRTLFLSDVHLGYGCSRARELSRFLERIQCEKLYLVGDIIDGWRLANRWHWPASHSEVLRHLLDIARQGTEVIYIPGNHDELARAYVGLDFGGICLRSYDHHTTADGRRLLVTHGDQFDFLLQHARWTSWLGGLAYEWLIRINHACNGLRRLVGRPYWSLSRVVTKRFKSAMQYVEQFEKNLLDEARRQGVDGVVCGHVHCPALRQEDVLYLNCGDWVEHCTVLAESEDGRIELLEGRAFLEAVPDLAPESVFQGQEAA